MKRLATLAALALVLLVFAAPAAAQAADQKPPDQVAMWIVIASGFSMAIASAFFGPAQAQAAARAAACEGLARNPGAAPAIRFSLILALVLIESLALYTFAIVFLKVTY